MIWKACIRLGIKPPGIPDKWEDCTSDQQSLILGFHQLCEHDEAESFTGMKI